MKKALLLLTILVLCAFAHEVTFGRRGIVHDPATVLSCGEVPSFTLMFAASSTSLSRTITAQLTSLAAAMRENPDCRVVITGNAGGTKTTQQLSWDRVEAIIVYMGDVQNIDRNRFIFSYEGTNGAAADAVTAVFTEGTTEGPSSAPPPHPDLRAR